MKRRITITEGQPGVWGYLRIYLMENDGKVWRIDKHLKTGEIKGIKELRENPFPPMVWEELGEEVGE